MEWFVLLGVLALAFGLSAKIKDHRADGGTTGSWISLQLDRFHREFSVPRRDPALRTATPGPPHETTGQNGLAIASMVLGLISLVVWTAGIVAAILGHVALRQIKRRGGTGRGMAIAGIAAGWFAFAVDVTTRMNG